MHSATNIAQVPSLVFCIVFLPFFFLTGVVFPCHHLTFLLFFTVAFHFFSLSLAFPFYCVALLVPGWVFTFFFLRFFDSWLINSLLYGRVEPQHKKTTRPHSYRKQRVKRNHLCLTFVESEKKNRICSMDSTEFKWMAKFYNWNVRQAAKSDVSLSWPATECELDKKMIKSRCKLQINFNKNSPIGMKCQQNEKKRILNHHSTHPLPRLCSCPPFFTEDMFLFGRENIWTKKIFHLNWF